MRILWVSHILLYPETGYGALQRSRNLLLELAKHNEVHLICLTNSYNKDAIDLTAAQLDLEKYCKSVHFINNSNQLKKYSSIAQSLIFGNSYTEKLYNSRLLKSLVKKIVDKENVELVHLDTIGLFDDIKSVCKVRASLNHHNFESRMMKERANREENILKKLFILKEAQSIARLEKQIANTFDVNIFVSKNDLSDFNKEIVKVNSAVIENPVDLDIFKYQSELSSKKNIIFVGGLDWYPNLSAVNYFINSILPQLIERDNQIKFYVVGREVKGLPQHPHVIYTGFVADLQEYLSSARVFVCPMLEGGGTRLKVIDALAAGIPLVST
ncbi:MAG: glycosyltransferase, partial [Proteobacteria bacterium]|nr:glycosyltransferase [Pseudomonadota bacterium]